MHKFEPMLSYLPQALDIIASIVIIAAIVFLYFNIKALSDTANKNIAISQKMVKLHLIDNLELHKLTVERVALLRMYAEASGCTTMSDAETALYNVICENDIGKIYYQETVAAIKDLRDELRKDTEEGL